MVPVNGERVGVKATDEALSPAAGFYDPDLFATTPTDVLTGSAMKGFDKGLEALYSRDANPLTDAMVIRGLQYMQSGLPHLVDTDDASVIEEVVVGTVLVQYGCSIGTSIVHSYGHVLWRIFGVQQGIAHAVMVPHALRLLFDRVDGLREALADALLGTERPPDPATAVIDRVTEIRDAMDVTSRLQDPDVVSEEKLRHVAKLTHDDPNMENTPRCFESTVDDLETVLCNAW